MNKISTVEELQAQLRAIWAMTEGSSPSKTKLSKELRSLVAKLSKGSWKHIDVYNYDFTSEAKRLKEACGRQDKESALKIVSSMIHDLTGLKDDLEDLE